jgi:hypothetical protein
LRINCKIKGLAVFRIFIMRKKMNIQRGDWGKFGKSFGWKEVSDCEEMGIVWISLDFGWNRAGEILFLHFKIIGRFWVKSKVLIRWDRRDPRTFGNSQKLGDSQVEGLWLAYIFTTGRCAIHATDTQRVPDAGGVMTIWG